MLVIVSWQIHSILTGRSLVRFTNAVVKVKLMKKGEHRFNNQPSMYFCIINILLASRLYPLQISPFVVVVVFFFGSAFTS